MKLGIMENAPAILRNLRWNLMKVRRIKWHDGSNPPYHHIDVMSGTGAYGGQEHGFGMSWTGLLSRPEHRAVWKHTAAHKHGNARTIRATDAKLPEGLRHHTGK